MRRTLLIHDLEDNCAPDMPEHMLVFPAKPAVMHCIGCFSCWIKTPGRCVLPDRCGVVPSMVAASDEMRIVSRLVYGGFSQDVKAVLDRSIGYILPYFRIIHGEMHHTMRYDNPFALKVRFYGENIPDTEKTLAEQLVAANALNLGAGSHSVSFYASAEMAMEALA